MTCDSCGQPRTPDELQPALTVFWEVIPGRYNCRNGDECFDYRFRDILPKKGATP